MNLSYETALKLKEAGFPVMETLVFDGIPIIPDLPHGTAIIKNLVLPTLSELIEACGELASGKGVTLKVDHQADYAHAHTDTRHGGSGPTPEEAVAALWLALQK